MVQEAASREGVEQTKLFIRVNAAFQAEDTPNPELLGMDYEQFAEPEFRPVYINITQIVTAYINSQGGFNITTSDGDKWSTSPTSNGEIAEFMDQLSVNIS